MAEVNIKIRLNGRDSFCTTIHDDMDSIEFNSVIDRFIHLRKMYPLQAEEILVKKSNGKKIWTPEQIEILKTGILSGKTRKDVAETLFGLNCDKRYLIQVSNKMSMMKKQVMR